jgi:hypothetical protein
MRKWPQSGTRCPGRRRLLSSRTGTRRCSGSGLRRLAARVSDRRPLFAASDATSLAVRAEARLARFRRSARMPYRAVRTPIRAARAKVRWRDFGAQAAPLGVSVSAQQMAARPNCRRPAPRQYSRPTTTEGTLRFAGSFAPPQRHAAAKLCHLPGLEVQRRDLICAQAMLS